MPPAVVNASPLIFLAKLERLDALAVFNPVYTTPQVLAEVDVGLQQGYREALSVRRAIDDGAISVRRAAPLTLPPPRLDVGELSVLSLAQGIAGSTAVVDDLAAIRAAKHLGVRVRSTPLVLLDNVVNGRVTPAEFRTLMDALLVMEYHISPALFLLLVEASDRPSKR